MNMDLNEAMKGWLKKEGYQRGEQEPRSDPRCACCDRVDALFVEGLRAELRKALDDAAAKVTAKAPASICWADRVEMANKERERWADMYWKATNDRRLAEKNVAELRASIEQQAKIIADMILRNLKVEADAKQKLGRDPILPGEVIYWRNRFYQQEGLAAQAMRDLETCRAEARALRFERDRAVPELDNAQYMKRCAEAQRDQARKERDEAQAKITELEKCRDYLTERLKEANAQNLKKAFYPIDFVEGLVRERNDLREQLGQAQSELSKKKYYAADYWHVKYDEAVIERNEAQAKVMSWATRGTQDIEHKLAEERDEARAGEGREHQRYVDACDEIEKLRGWLAGEKTDTRNLRELRNKHQAEIERLTTALHEANQGVCIWRGKHYNQSAELEKAVAHATKLNSDNAVLNDELFVARGALAEERKCKQTTYEFNKMLIGYQDRFLKWQKAVRASWSAYDAGGCSIDNVRQAINSDEGAGPCAKG